MQDLKQKLKNWRGRKVLMAIYPHPDDESIAAGGLLLAAKQAGWITIAVVLTRGGAGQMHIHPNGRTTKAVRLSELHKAAKILGFNHLEVGDFDDGKLREQRAKWSGWVNKLITKHRPSWLVTFDHSGVSGHPDHISLSLSLKNTSAKLFWTTFPKEMILGNQEVLKYRTQPTHKLDLGFWGLRKWLAVRAHASQKLPHLRLDIYTREWYHEVDKSKNYPYKFVKFDI